MADTNVIFILTDQWPSWALGFLGAGVATPNVDRLAARGTLFPNAFTSCPLCTPARGTLLTARWPHQTGVRDNRAGYALQEPMSMDEPTWIEAVVRGGYHVGYFGKWHLGPNDPQARGAHRTDPRPPAPPPSKRPFSYQVEQDRYVEEGRRRLVRGLVPFWGETGEAKETVRPFPTMHSGVRFLQEWAAGDREAPFFLTVSSTPPHFPHYLPAEYARIADGLRETVELPASLADDCAGRPWFHSAPWWPCMDTSLLDEEAWRTVIAYSHAHITMVDEAIGRVLDTLERLRLRDSTTVVFAADHGDMEGAHNRFDKGAYFYEEVWRIPLIICRPGAPAATRHAFVSLLDVGETLFDLAGAGDDGPPRAGRSLLPLVGSPEELAGWPDVVYGVYDLYNGMSFGVRAIRDERWKYVWNPQAFDELYDLASDPHEMVNRIDDPAAAEEGSRLRGQLLTWLADVGDDLPDRADELPPAGTIVATGEPGP